MDMISKWIGNKTVKWETHLDFVTDFLLNVHFVGKIEITTATGATRLWNEDYGSGLCCTLSYLGGSECSLRFFQCSFALFY